MPNLYQVRNDLLQQLGFACYEDYLASNAWYHIRKKRMALDNDRCACCGKLAYQVHHRSYDRATLLGEDLSQLISLCTPCHRAIEFRAGVKVSFEETEYRLRGKLAWYRTKQGTTPPKGRVAKAKTRHRRKKPPYARMKCVSCGRWHTQRTNYCKWCESNVKEQVVKPKKAPYTPAVVRWGDLSRPGSDPG